LKQKINSAKGKKKKGKEKMGGRPRHRQCGKKKKDKGERGTVSLKRSCLGNENAVTGSAPNPNCCAPERKKPEKREKNGGGEGGFECGE